MAFIHREYVPGDQITVKTNIHHEANIAGVEAIYRNRDSGVGEIVLSEGKTGGPELGTPTNHPGPYLTGHVVVEGTINADQEPGVYVLESVVFVTANKQRLPANNVPESHIRVKDVPQEIFINGWELDGGESVREFEEGTSS